MDTVEKVESDSELSGDEKETTITMYGTDKEATVTSSKPTIVRSLLEHDHADIEWVAGEDDGSYSKVAPDDTDELGAIYTISATLPIGCLTVKPAPRTRNNQSGIVNTETVSAEAFS